MEWISGFLVKYPELALFLAIAIGYWLGGFSFGGFSFGPVTGSLFAGILIGQIAEVPVSAMAKSFLFLLFLFGKNPRNAYADIFSSTLGSAYGFSEMLVRMIPLVLTALAVVVLMLAAVDIAFALDSIPTVVSLVRDNAKEAFTADDKLVIYSSNIFAILGGFAAYKLTHSAEQLSIQLPAAVLLTLLACGAAADPAAGFALRFEPEAAPAAEEAVPSPPPGTDAPGPPEASPEALEGNVVDIRAFRRPRGEGQGG